MNKSREFWLVLSPTRNGISTSPIENAVHVIEKSTYDELLKKYAKLYAKEINGTLRTYDGIVPALEEKVDELQNRMAELTGKYITLEKKADKLVKALEVLDQRLCERIIDPCGYEPAKENKGDLVNQIEVFSDENKEDLMNLRKALAEYKGTNES